MVVARSLHTRSGDRDTSKGEHASLRDRGNNRQTRDVWANLVQRLNVGGGLLHQILAHQIALDSKDAVRDQGIGKAESG